MILMSCWLIDDVWKEGSLGKHNDTETLREDKWSHLYTVYHPDTPANRLYGAALKYGQKSHNQSSRRLDKHVLNRITKAREETKVCG